jgi:hypothetical protein
VSRLDSEPRVLADIPLAIDPDEVMRFQGYFRQCARCWMASCGERRTPAPRTGHR